MKYLLWAVIIYLAWRWYTASRSSSSSTESPRKPQNVDADDRAEAMVKCAQCGIHLPHSEAVHGTGSLVFCTEEHRRLHGNVQ